MAKTKADFLQEAKELNLDVTEKNTVAEIKEAIANASSESKDEKEESFAKAGKRSKKGVEEAKEKAEKIERQQADDEANETESEKPKQPVKPARPRSERRGKGYKASYELVDKKKTYTLKEATELATKTSHVKFDASVELHVRLGVDPRQADQNIRDNIVLPEGTGKDVKVAVFADSDDVKAAKAAGADIAGSDEFLEQLEANKIDFDVLVATPKMMPKLGKYARVLGPRGLMPNPKSGTVTDDVAKAVKEAKAGKVEYRVDEAGIVHVAFGKVSFGAARLLSNALAIAKSVKSNKPSTIKGNYVQSVYITTSMGPSIKIDPSEITNA